MVKVEIGVKDPKTGIIDPTKQKCLGCGAEFYYPYCDWAGGIWVRPVCPECREPIEYVSEGDSVFRGETIKVDLGFNSTSEGVWVDV